MAQLNKGMIFGVLILIFGLVISGCGPSPEQEAAPNIDLPSPTIQITKPPAGTKAPSTLEILKDMDPTYEIFFDGEECIVEGPSELNTGEYLFILNNQTDLPANLSLGSLFGERTFDDYLLWQEENCGGEGSHCEDDDGQYISFEFATWYNPKKQANEGIETQYKLFDINMEREYLIWVDLDMWWGWLCAPIQVSK